MSFTTTESEFLLSSIATCCHMVLVAGIYLPLSCPTKGKAAIATENTSVLGRTVNGLVSALTVEEDRSLHDRERSFSEASYLQVDSILFERH